MALGVCCVTYLFFCQHMSETLKIVTKRFAQKSRSYLSLNTLAVECRMGLGLSTYIQYGWLYGSKSMNMLITMAPKCGTPHPCGQVVNSDGLLKWHSLFCLFNHSFIHFTILPFEKTESCKQIVWLFQIADNFSRLCNRILLSASQSKCSWSSWMGLCVFLFVWYDILHLREIMFHICVISYFVFYLQ